MFGPRRRRGGRGGGLGMMLMAMQFFQFFNFLSQSDRFFPITMAVMAVNIVTYLRPPGLNMAWPSLHQACISLKRVWFQGEWKRIFMAPFIHSHDYHLYYNMASFMWKAVSLERHFGSSYFLYMVSVFSVGTSLVYLAIQYVLREVMEGMFYTDSCAVGFSGVIFALKVVTTHMQPNGISMIMGMFPVPARLACWAELVLISVLFPNVSFVGHLSGILVGLAFVAGPLKSLMDIPVAMFENSRGFPPTPRPPGQNGSYTYRASTTGYRAPPVVPPHRPDNNRGTGDQPPHASSRPDNTSYTYAARTTGYVSQNNGTTGREMEEEELQEAIRMSLRDGNPRNDEEDLTVTSLERDHSPAPSAPPPHYITSNTDREMTHDGNRIPDDSQPSYNPVYDHGHPATASDSGGPRLEGRGDEGALLPLGSGGYEAASEKRTLRRRHMEDNNNGERSRELPSDVHDIRAARLKRFEKNKNN